MEELAVRSHYAIAAVAIVALDREQETGSFLPSAAARLADVVLFQRRSDRHE